jgi:hypothetical protein
MPRLAHEHSGSPTRAANIARNLGGGHARRRSRWRPVREALWELLDRHVPAGATVAIVGAGNGDDVPLRRLCRRVARLDLIDLDPGALRRARRRCRFAGARVRTLVEDVSDGVADAIVHAALDGTHTRARPSAAPVGAPPYDVVVSDLLATQLLFPALSDARLPGDAIDRTLLRDGRPLTDAVVARMHAAAPNGLVIHIHDLLGWWEGHEQPFALERMLALAQSDPTAALALARDGAAPYGCDPREASTRLDATIIDTAFWHWPFAPGTDYLVCASVAASAGST